MTRVGASECGQRMSFKICDGVLNKPQIKGETKLPSATPTASNGAEGFSDIEHVAIGIARVDGNAARVAGASTGQCE